MLVVEDETLISMLIEDNLIDFGCQVAGVAARLPDALQKAQFLELDIAVLDINLAGEKSFPVAEILRGRNIPFVFLSGYGPRGLSAEFQHAPILTKPFNRTALSMMLAAACAGSRADPA